MKKGLVVLLLAVLLSGFVFAGTFHGSAAISFGVDFDEQEWGFANTTKGKYSFKFEFDTTKVSLGSEHTTDVWAELEATATAYASLSSAGLASSATTVQPKYTAKITTANIHIGEDLTIGILNSGTAGDYVAHYNLDSNGDPIYDVVAGDSKVVPGFIVTFKDWNGGFGAKGAWDSDPATYTVWGHIETPKFTFGENDEIGVEAGGYAVMDSSDKYIGGGFIASYAADKLSVDFGADGVVKKASVDFGFESALNATYDFVTLNVYAASGAYFGYADDEPVKLDAKLSAAYTFDFNEDVALDVTGYVEVEDALVDALVLTVGSTQKTAIDKIGITLAEDLTLENLANDADLVTKLALSAKVDYTAEKFYAYAQVKPSFQFDSVDNNRTLTALGFECGISSTKVIENATVGLKYAGADFAQKPAVDEIKAKGAITASATITF